MNEIEIKFEEIGNGVFQSLYINDDLISQCVLTIRKEYSDVLGGKEFLLIENDNKTGIFNISGKNFKIISQFMKSREGKSWFRTQTAGLDRHQRNRLKGRILKPKANIQLWAGWIYKIIEEIKKDNGSK